MGSFFDPESHALGLSARFDLLKEAVLAKRPVLREIIEKHGGKSLCRYAQDYFDVNHHPLLPARQEEFLGVFREQVERLLGNEVAAAAVRQLKKSYFVSTADHHGPICHPFFLSSNLLTAITDFEKNDPDLNNVIVLACATVSLDNSSFPRGLMFNSLVDNKVQMQRVAFFSSHERPALVSLLRAYGPGEIQKVHKMVTDLERTGSVHPLAGKTMHEIIEEVYNQPEVLQAANYSDQITKTNYQLWKRFFKSCNLHDSNLIYLELEDIVMKLLLAYHLDQDTIIHRLLFDEQYHELALKYFDNVLGAFSTAKKWGSYLFWAIPKGERYRIQLWKQGNELVSSDGKYRLPLNPTAVRQAIAAKEIMPSLMLDFILLSCYYGLKCLGGFSQVNYLTFMRDAYQKLLAAVGLDPVSDISATTQTKELVGDITAVFLGGRAGQLVPAASLDLILYGDQNTWSILNDRIHDITLAEALAPMMPEFYRIIYPEPERNADLLSIAAAEITTLIGLDKKIKPCLIVQ